MMEQITDDVWTVPAPQKYLGLSVGTRMTVCRLSDSSLVLISPIALTDKLKAQVDALGPVRAFVAPNLMHHLYIGEWAATYPDVVVYGPPGLSAKRSDLTLTHELGSAYDEHFGHELQRFSIAGIPKLNESLFFHTRSNTLIVTDFCFYAPDISGLSGFLSRLVGIHKRPRCEPSVRILIKDKAAFRKSLEPLRSLHVEHLSMCHHYVLSTGASHGLQRVLDDLKVSGNHSTNR